MLVLFKNYVCSIMLQLDAVIIREPFEHNFPSNSLIILVILYFCMYILCILSINHVYIVFTAVLMGLGKILGEKFILVIFVSDFLYFSKF